MIACCDDHREQGKHAPLVWGGSLTSGGTAVRNWLVTKPSFHPWYDESHTAHNPSEAEGKSKWSKNKVFSCSFLAKETFLGSASPFFVSLEARELHLWENSRMGFLCCAQALLDWSAHWLGKSYCFSHWQGKKLRLKEFPFTSKILKRETRIERVRTAAGLLVQGVGWLRANDGRFQDFQPLPQSCASPAFSASVTGKQAFFVRRNHRQDQSSFWWTPPSHMWPVDAIEKGLC